jgi:hypothetical protein
VQDIEFDLRQNIRIVNHALTFEALWQVSVVAKTAAA